MTITSKLMAVVVTVVLLGGILVSSALGWWQTESSKVAAVYSAGEYAGQANPADIRGSYTFGDVEKNFAVPAAVLVQAFNIQTESPAAFQVKELETLYADSPEEIGTVSVRLFVAFYLGLPIDLSVDIYLPDSAAGLLGDRNLTSEQAAYLQTHTVALGGGEPAAVDIVPVNAAVIPQVTQPTAPQSTPQGDESHTPDDRLVRGKTTFAELLEWGVAAETIEALLRAPLPASTGMTLKDFCSQQGVSFEDVKAALQAEVDQSQ